MKITVISQCGREEVHHDSTIKGHGTKIKDGRIIGVSGFTVANPSYVRVHFWSDTKRVEIE